MHVRSHDSKQAMKTTHELVNHAKQWRNIFRLGAITPDQLHKLPDLIENWDNMLSIMIMISQKKAQMDFNVTVANDFLKQAKKIFDVKMTEALPSKENLFNQLIVRQIVTFALETFFSSASRWESVFANGYIEPFDLVRMPEWVENWDQFIHLMVRFAHGNIQNTLYGRRAKSFLITAMSFFHVTSEDKLPSQYDLCDASRAHPIINQYMKYAKIFNKIQQWEALLFFKLIETHQIASLIGSWDDTLKSLMDMQNQDDSYGDIAGQFLKNMMNFFGLHSIFSLPSQQDISEQLIIRYGEYRRSYKLPHHYVSALSFGIFKEKCDQFTMAVNIANALANVRNQLQDSLPEMAKVKVEKCSMDSHAEEYARHEIRNIPIVKHVETLCHKLKMEKERLQSNGCSDIRLAVIRVAAVDIHHVIHSINEYYIRHYKEKYKHNINNDCTIHQIECQHHQADKKFKTEIDQIIQLAFIANRALVKDNHSDWGMSMADSLQNREYQAAKRDIFKRVSLIGWFFGGSDNKPQQNIIKFTPQVKKC